jgi:IclR family KDG regulon transcriptional repressor
MILKKEKSNAVKSVLKALMILDELNKADELSLGELSQRLSIDKATVHRLVNTLKEAGYVNQNKENKKYFNSFKLFEIGSRAIGKTGLRKVARPYLEELASITKETVNLGVRTDTRILYIDKIESNSTIKVGLDIGTSVPSYCSGMGKTILAFTALDELGSILDQIDYRQYTENTITDREKLLEALKDIRNTGYSIDDEEFVEGLICFGAPVFDYSGHILAAISVACPKYRYDKEKHMEMYCRLVKETAERISEDLGYK